MICSIQLTLEFLHSMGTPTRLGRQISETYISPDPRHLRYMAHLLRQPKLDGKPSL